MYYVIEHSTPGGGNGLSTKLATDAVIEQAMKKMGKLIMQCRKTRSLRKIAEPCGISASQLQSIERGILAPTADVYFKLVQVLLPTTKERKALDRYYMAIRKTPPPDVCKIIIANETLIDAIRSLDGIVLTDTQSAMLKEMFASFALEDIKGDTDNG